jgi:hypothetical protein
MSTSDDNDEETPTDKHHATCSSVKTFLHNSNNKLLISDYKRTN